MRLECEQVCNIHDLDEHAGDVVDL